MFYVTKPFHFSFIVPVLLIIWKKFIEPYVWPHIYKYWYGVEYKKDETDKNGPFNCDGGKCIFAPKSKPVTGDTKTETVASAGTEETDKKTD